MIKKMIKKMINKIKDKITEIYKNSIIDYKKLENFFEKDFKKDSFKNAFRYCKHLIATNMFYLFLFNIVMFGAGYLIAYLITTNINMFCPFLFNNVMLGAGVVTLLYFLKSLYLEYLRKKKNDKKDDKKDDKKNDK